MGTAEDCIDVEVVYALPAGQRVYAVRIERRATARAAVIRSGVLADHPEIDLATCALGVFGERVQPQTELNEGDRVEIYRPLIADAKESRRRRAARRVVR